MIKRCGWCGKRIPQDAEVFGLRCKYMPGTDISGPETRAIALYVHAVRRWVPAIVPAQGSPAKQEGTDLVFAVCSDSCGKSLKAALAEKLLGSADLC
jgi:hypothetical protein